MFVLFLSISKERFGKEKGSEKGKEDSAGPRVCEPAAIIRRFRGNSASEPFRSTHERRGRSKQAKCWRSALVCSLAERPFSSAHMRSGRMRANNRLHVKFADDSREKGAPSASSQLRVTDADLTKIEVLKGGPIRNENRQISLSL